MFTGIIQQRAEVTEVALSGETAQIEIHMREAADIVIGESIAVDGVCLTVSGKNEPDFVIWYTPVNY